MDFIFILVLLLEVVVSLAYGVFVFYDMYRRNQNLVGIDDKMLNTGRIISWIGVLGLVAISRNIRDNFYLFFVLFNILQFPYYIGFRLKNLSLKVKEEDNTTFYYTWDQWLEKMYRKYLGSLWKDKE